MALPVVVIELGSQLAMARDLAAGRVFVPGCVMAINSDCEVIVRGAGDAAMMVAARVVFVDEPRGVGLELLEFTRPKRLRLAELVASVTIPEAEPLELELAPHVPPPVIVPVAPESEPVELLLAEPTPPPPPPVLDSPSQLERRRASAAPPLRNKSPTEDGEEFEAPTTYRKVDRGFVRNAPPLPDSGPTPAPPPAPAIERRTGPQAITAFELEAVAAADAAAADDADRAAALEEDTVDEHADDVVHRAIPKNVHERLRGLTLAEQIKAAFSADPQERIALERLYGKNVWEALLRNPRLTAPEVVRLARMGTMPKILVEVIVSNGAWVAIPEVRRALLANPRLAADQIPRVLRAMNKHELKLASTQMIYPAAVREAAKRLFRGG